MALLAWSLNGAYSYKLQYRQTAFFVKEEKRNCRGRIGGLRPYLQYVFIDGKLYTLFFLLFGVGFAIFYRRMAILMLIGGLHLMFIWSGDIRMLYALLGLLLPLFRNMPDKRLLAWAAFFLLLPVVVDSVIRATNINLSAPIMHANIFVAKAYDRDIGIRY